MTLYGTNQDTMNVRYKTSATGAYTLLAGYTNRVATWTQRVIPLPNPNSTYCVAFEGNALGGFGVFIEDVAITADYPAPASFSAWAQVRCPGVSAAVAFCQDRDRDGVPNGFEYAFGTNWTTGEPLLSILRVSGVPTVQIPRLAAEASPYAQLILESSSALQSAAWATNGLHGISAAGKPANCDWLQPDTPGTNLLVRLRAALLE